MSTSPRTPPSHTTYITGPRFSTPDHWNQTGEEIEFTPWEEDTITIVPGGNIKPLLPKLPRKTKFSSKTKPSTKSKAPRKTYKAPRTIKGSCEAKERMETNLPRKPLGKRVLPSPETLVLTRFRPVGYMDLMDRRVGKQHAPALKSVEDRKKDKKKDTEKKRKITAENKMPPRPLRSVALTNPLAKSIPPGKPERKKKWFEEIDEDLLKGTKYARHLNQNSLQREYGNPGVLPVDKREGKSHDNRGETKRKESSRSKPVAPSLQLETQNETDQQTPATPILECAPPAASKPAATESNQKLDKVTILTDNTKDQKFGFENLSFESISESDVRVLQQLVTSAQENG
ncbi:hypothetical protein TWF281_011422 [Arthrobotrys megalospora]